MATTHDPDVEAIRAAIARSPIVVARIVVWPKGWPAQRPVGTPAQRPAHLRCHAERFPAGYDEGDIAILEWIAGEARRAGRRFVRI